MNWLLSRKKCSRSANQKITFEVIILTNHQPHIIISLKTTLVQLTYIHLALERLKGL